MLRAVHSEEYPRVQETWMCQRLLSIGMLMMIFAQVLGWCLLLLLLWPQAFAQVPDIRVYYGPDTYMGRNLATMLATIARLPDEEVGSLVQGLCVSIATSPLQAIACSLVSASVVIGITCKVVCTYHLCSLTMVLEAVLGRWSMCYVLSAVGVPQLGKHKSAGAGQHLSMPHAHVSTMCAGEGTAPGAHRGQRGGRTAAAALLRGGQLRGAPYVWRAGHRARARGARRRAAYRAL